VQLGSARPCLAGLPPVVVMDVIKAQGRTRLINWCTLADLSIGVGFLLVLIRPFGFVGASLYISLTSLTTAASYSAWRSWW
jgi:hypothetical protein